MSDTPLCRLREALGRPPGAARISRPDLVELLRCAELAERLRGYAAHRPDCRFLTERRPYGTTTIPGPCSCGLNDVLAGRFPGEPDPETMGGRAARRPAATAPGPAGPAAPSPPRAAR